MTEVCVVTSRYQITIPKRLRKNLKVEEGDRLLFIPIEGGRYIVDVVKTPKDAAKAIDGILSDLDLDAVTARHLAPRSHARKRLEELRME